MICAMKTGGRLGQSRGPQTIEEMGFFGRFSSPREAVLRGVEKSDSQALKGVILSRPDGPIFGQARREI
jgi:hypothetical protein